MRIWIFTSLGLLLGCPRPIHPDFDQARQSAMQSVSSTTPPFVPDARLILKQVAISSALEAYSGTLDPMRTSFDLGVASVHPRVTIEQLSLAPQSPDCTPCLRLRGELGGTAGVVTPLGDTRFPLTASFTLDLSLVLRNTAPGKYRLVAMAKEVRKLKLEAAGVHADIGAWRGPIRSWIDDALVKDLAPMELVEVDLTGLPVMQVAVSTAPGLVVVNLRTDVPHAQFLDDGIDVPDSDWSLHLTPPVVLGMMRRAAFSQDPFEVKKGPFTYSILAEPRGVDFLQEGRFRLALRLWSLRGRGWWRDYDVSGALVIHGKKVIATAEEIEPIGASPGAFFADPLVALAQSRVLEALSDGVSAPFDHKLEHQDEHLTSVVRVRSIEESEGVVKVQGTLKVEPLQPSPTPRHEGLTRPVTEDVP
jgi:hypothetical protein